MGRHRLAVRGVGVLCLMLVFSLRAAAAEPDMDKVKVSEEMKAALKLTAQIDQLVAAHWESRGAKPAPVADDAEFIRRVYLDLAGRIPHISEVRKFLDDKSPDKRVLLIQELLVRMVEDKPGPNPNYVNNFTAVWRALMIPQTNNQQFNQFGNQLDNWLKARLRENIAYDQMVRDLITSSVGGVNPQGGRPPGFNPNEPNALAFFQANEFKPENVAAATSRLFLGVKLECAQCHDHPFAKWKRDQFWEYAAFFSGITPQRGGFAAQRDESGKREIAIPNTDRKAQAKFLDGKEPEWKEGVPTRTTLAEWMTSPDNPFFAKAAVNRLWGHFLGIGLVEPIDEMVGAESVASNTELLDLLAKEFVASKFDVKHMIRAITASKAYQLTSEQTDPSQADPRMLARMNLKGLTPEQLFDSLAMATGFREQGIPNQRLGFGVNSARGEFLAKFANHSDKRTEYSTSILQALMLMNGRFTADATDLVRSGTLAGVLDSPFLDTTEKKIETLYLSTLNRKPRAEELAMMVKYVDKDNPSGDSKKALADVLWVLLNSSEFILNH